MVKTEEILRFEENPKKSRNRINFHKRKSSYHIWEVNHQLCEEMWSTPLKSEDLKI